MNVKKCNECIFFVSEDDARSQSFGKCVYYPPVIAPNGNTAFPSVFSEWRCGKGVKKGVGGR